MSDAAEHGRAFPPPLDQLGPVELAALQEIVEPVRFAAGSCLFAIGSAGDCCYIVDEGVVSIKLDGAGSGAGSEIDSDDTLAYVEPGSVLGELSLLDGEPRSASGYAESDVTARRISAAAVQGLADSNPRLALALFQLLGRSAALRLRATNERLAAFLFREAPDADVDRVVAQAVLAQQVIQGWPEERVDALLHDMGAAIATHAEELARECVEESGMGDVAGKTTKIRGVATALPHFLAGMVGQGFLSSDESLRISKIAAPMGVIFAVIPVTSQVASLIFKSVIAVKSRNAVILSPHRDALRVCAHAHDLLLEVLRRHGAPDHLVQCVRQRASRMKTVQYMTHPGVALILATGGASLVKTAYSSGKPAIGVGPGNTPVLICADADLATVAGQIIASKTFDHGLMCGSEHNLVVVAGRKDALAAELERQGAAVLSAEEAARFTEWVVNEEWGTIDGKVVGKAAQITADAAGIEREHPIALIVVPTEGIGRDNPLAFEKMAPILSLFTVPDEEAGIVACERLLELQGSGHTAVIHTQDEALIQRFALRIPTGRVLVNSPATQGMVGLTSGLPIGTMVGCGTFGGNSTTDNITYAHLQNVKRLVRFLPERVELLQSLAAAST